MSAHTPGPWVLIDDDFIYRLTDSGTQNRFWCQVSSVRRIHDGAAGDDEVAANARLIAAAPDLLAALKGALAALEQPKTFPVDVDVAKKWMRAAIAKAEGKP